MDCPNVSDGGCQVSFIWFGEIAVALSALGVVVCPVFAEALDDEALVPSELIAYTR